MLLKNIRHVDENVNVIRYAMHDNRFVLYDRTGTALSNWSVVDFDYMNFPVLKFRRSKLINLKLEKAFTITQVQLDIELETAHIKNHTPFGEVIVRSR